MENDKFERSKYYDNQLEAQNFFAVSNSQDVLSDNSLNYRHLNDLDTNILESEAYKNINNDSFKIEYKISQTEENLNELDKQIMNAREIRDFTLVEALTNQRKNLQIVYKDLLEKYNQESMTTKISGNLFSLFKYLNIFHYIGVIFNGIFEFLVSKLSKNSSYVIELKDSLKKLENINKSVDEIIKLSIPYGENFEKYDQLSKYIVKANSINNKIDKSSLRKN